MRSHIVTIALAAVCLSTASAQNAGPPAVIEILREAIKEGRAAAHEKVEAEEARAWRKAKVPYHYLALATMTGAPEVWFTVAFSSFADVEKAGSELEKQPLKGEIETLDARDGELRSLSRTMFAVYRKDMSYHPELANISKARFVAIASYRVKLGHTDELTAGSKMILGAWEKANLQFPVLAYEVMAGVPDGLFLFIEPMESLKSLDEGPARDRAMVEAMGPENFSRLMKGTGDVFANIETSVFAVNPAMSYVSKEIEDSDPDFWRPKAAAKPAAESKPKEKAAGQ